MLLYCAESGTACEIVDFGDGESDVLKKRNAVEAASPRHGGCRFSQSMTVGQVCNLPLLPIFNFLFFLVHPVGRLETCPTTKSTVPMRRRILLPEDRCR
jgi:hypothetical protein